MNKGISINEDFTDGYLTRGELYLEKGDYTNALSDFGKVQSLSPKLSSGYIGAGNCFEGLGDNDKAIKTYSAAIEVDPKAAPEILFKRGRLYYKTKNMELALNDISKYVKTIDDTNVEALLMLGKIQRKTGDANNAFINFEQVIKYDKEGSATLTAIIKMAKIKLKQKDFYGAHHTLERPTVLNIKSNNCKKLNNYLTLTEAVINNITNRYCIR